MSLILYWIYSIIISDLKTPIIREIIKNVDKVNAEKNIFVGIFLNKKNNGAIKKMIISVILKLTPILPKLPKIK